MKSCDYSKGKLGTAKGSPASADYSQNKTGSSTKGAHDASQSGGNGDVKKAGSVADGHGKTDSMGTAHNKPASGHASTNMKDVAGVADGKR
jgi:hypothetical protein